MLFKCILSFSTRVLIGDPSNQARKRPATVLGDFAVDLKVLADAGAFQGACLGKHATFVFSQVRD